MVWLDGRVQACYRGSTRNLDETSAQRAQRADGDYSVCEMKVSSGSHASCETCRLGGIGGGLGDLTVKRMVEIKARQIV